MRKLFLLSLYLALTLPILTVGVFAQTPSQPFSITSNQCASIDSSNTGSVGISVTGTWTGTLLPYVSIAGDPVSAAQVTPYNSNTAQSSITANGAYYAATSGSTLFELCGNTVNSGTAVVKLYPSTRSSGNGGGGGGSGGSPNQEVTFTNATSASLSLVGLTPNVIPKCWDSANPANEMAGWNSTLNLSTFAIDFSFLIPQSGYCTVNQSGAGGGGGGVPYPGAGVACSTGSAWCAPYQIGTGANDLPQLNGSSQLPAVSAALLIDFPLFGITNGGTGTASVLTGVVRGGNPFAASELSGDATTSGSNAVSVTGLHFGSTAIPTSGTAPTSGQCLDYNGASIGGTACGSGGSPGGSVGQIQGNNTTFGGIPNSSANFSTGQLTFTYPDQGSSPIYGLHTVTNTATSSADTSVDNIFNSPAGSYHSPLQSGVDGFAQLTVCNLLSSHVGFVAIGSALVNLSNAPCSPISTSQFAKLLIMDSSAANSQLRLYQAAANSTAAQFEFFTHSSGTTCTVFETYAGVTSTDGSNGGGSLTSKLDCAGNWTLSGSITTSACTLGSSLACTGSPYLSGVIPGSAPTAPASGSSAIALNNDNFFAESANGGTFYDLLTTNTGTDNVNGSYGYAADTYSVPYTTGTTTPTVDATAAFNAMIAAVCPSTSAGAGCQIKLPPNSRFLLEPTTGQGTQIAIPILTNGVEIECSGGPGPQYTQVTQNAASCRFDIGTPGLYAFGCGQFGNGETAPGAGPLLRNVSVYDATTDHNAGGAFYSADCNGSEIEHLEMRGGFRQTALSAPSAPACSITSGGSITSGDQVNVELEAWTTSGPSLPSSSTSCGTTSSGNQSISVTIPTVTAPVIAYEVLVQVVGVNSSLVTASTFSYTTNADGSLTLTPGATTTPFALTTNPTATRKAVLVDDSHSNGLAFYGSIGWNNASQVTQAGFSNEPRVDKLKCLQAQGCVVAGVGSAIVAVNYAEVSSCDASASNGNCESGAGGVPTPGTIVGFGALQLNGVHATGYTTTSASTGPILTLTGFNNSVIGGTLQGNSGSTAIGISLISSTKATISDIGLANYGTGIEADTNSIGNKIGWMDNGTLTTPFDDVGGSGNGNAWMPAGRAWVINQALTVNSCTGCGSGSSGLSGMTASQVPIAATATTVTSSEALAGSGAGIVTGPTTSTSGDLVEYTGTAGQTADSGIVAANLITAPSAWYSPGTGGVSGLAVTLQNDTLIYPVYLGAGISSSTGICYYVAVADNSANVYDIGLFNSSGTLVVHTGATAGTTLFAATTVRCASWTASAALPAGYYALGMTSSAASPAAKFGGTTTSAAPFVATQAATGGTTTGGALSGPITFPTISWSGTTPELPNFQLH